MRRMNSRLLGHHGASARTDALVALDRELGLGVVPREREMHDRATGSRSGRAAATRLPRRRRSSSSASSEMIRGRSGPAASGYPARARRCRRSARPSMPGAARARGRGGRGRGRWARTRRGRAASPARRIVSAGRVAIGRVDVQHRASVGAVRERAAGRVAIGRRRRRASAMSRSCALRRAERVGVGDRAQPDAIAGAQLAELPAVGRGDRRRAHEAAQARAVGAEDDRHVAGEVDRADRVLVVVDVRRVQPGFAAVGSRPLRRGPDQAHAGAVGVVVHLPLAWRAASRCRRE